MGSEMCIRDRHSCGPLGLSQWKYKSFVSPLLRSQSREGALDVFPNPAFNELSFSLQNKIVPSFEITIVDLLGKIWVKEGKAGENATGTVPVDGLPNGIYIFSIESQSQRECVRFIVQR